MRRVLLSNDTPVVRVITHAGARTAHYGYAQYECEATMCAGGIYSYSSGMTSFRTWTHSSSRKLHHVASLEGAPYQQSVPLTTCHASQLVSNMHLNSHCQGGCQFSVETCTSRRIGISSSLARMSSCIRSLWSYSYAVRSSALAATDNIRLRSALH